MKKIIVSLFVILACCGFEAKAQWAVIDPSNLVQNILTVSKTATTASNVINSFQEMQKIYNQGKEYYDKLQSVHNLIKDARKVKETVEIISDISNIYATNYNKMLSDPNFTIEELVAISNGYAKLLNMSGGLLAEIKEIVSSSNGLSMTDKERMELIDKIYNDMRTYRSLVQYYTNKNISVSYLRAKVKKETDKVMVLYGNPADRYW
ncbi:MAG: DUF4141 domain-containing protein [Paludibacteraceae bacterium]